MLGQMSIRSMVVQIPCRLRSSFTMDPDGSTIVALMNSPGAAMVPAGSKKTQHIDVLYPLMTTTRWPPHRDSGTDEAAISLRKYQPVPCASLHVDHLPRSHFQINRLRFLAARALIWPIPVPVVEEEVLARSIGSLDVAARLCIIRWVAL